MSFTLSSLLLLLVSALHVLAESHTVRFQNNCGTGTPKLVQAGQILSTGEDYTSNGPINSAIAYLDRNNECLLNGEHCTLVEMNMNNPSCLGCGSSVDISLIPSHAFNVETSFAFFGGDGDVCDGLGAVCATANCNTAFFVPDDNGVQRACQADNVNLLITFCGGSTTSEFTEAVVGSMSGGSLPGVSGSSSKAEPSSSSTKAAPSPASSKIPATSSTPITSSLSSSKVATPTPTGKASADTSSTAIVNVGASSAVPSASDAGSSVSSAANASPTCRRKHSRSRRSKRALSHHERSQIHVRAFAGMHDSKF